MKQTERKVGDVIYIGVDKAAQIYAIGSDGNDVRYYYTYEGVRNFIYEKQNALLEKLHSNPITLASEMLEMLNKCYTGEIEEPYNNDELADLIVRAEGGE